MTTYAMSVLGCKVNAYEAESTAQSLRQCGYTEVGFKEKADVYLIFTCAVTNTASGKSRQRIHQAIRQNPDALICAVGCDVQINAQKLSQDERIDVLIGSADKDRIAELIGEALKRRQRLMRIADVRQQARFESLPLSSFQHQTRAYLKVQDGCNQFCAYCIIPYARGRERSMPLSEALREATQLAQHHPEIVLAGIHTGRYGKDIGTDLCALIRGLCAIEPLQRIRISSIEITEISDELLDLMAQHSRIARHLHIPLQSGCDATLQRMRRPYTTEQFFSRVEQIRHRFPDIAISTDLIVGFPGESEAEFAATMEFLNRIQFSFLHVFPFSCKSGTAAAAMKDQIDPQTKKQRVKAVGQISHQGETAMKKSRIGQPLDVLIETVHPGWSFGHSSEYLPVWFPCSLTPGQRVTGLGAQLKEDRLIAQLKEE